MTPRARRLSALAILLLLVLAGYAALVAPYQALLAAQEEALEEGRERLERLTRIAAGAAAASAALEAAGSAADAGTDPYLEGSSDALAAAGLQGLVGRIAEQAGLAIVSVEAVASGEAAAGRVALAVAATGPLDGVQRLLHAVEGGRPLLFVEELEIISGSTTEPRFDGRGQVEVSARMKIAGRRRPS